MLWQYVLRVIGAVAALISWFAIFVPMLSSVSITGIILGHIVIVPGSLILAGVLDPLWYWKQRRNKRLMDQVRNDLDHLVKNADSMDADTLDAHLRRIEEQQNRIR